jgi:acylphosphatase
MGDTRMRRMEMIIHGRVHGVFFRARTRSTARAIGARGIVRNTPDGKVHVIAEGTAEVVEELLAFCRRGPEGAIVHDIEYTWQEPTGTFDDFEITY